VGRGDCADRADGAVAGVLALPVGIMLAAVLVFVISKRSFG
jgi:hypothetical protein